MDRVSEHFCNGMTDWPFFFFLLECRTLVETFTIREMYEILQRTKNLSWCTYKWDVGGECHLEFLLL